MDVAAWLSMIGFFEFAQAFLYNSVDADVMPELKDADHNA